LQRFIIEPVSAPDLVWGPCTVVVEVVEGKEGGRIKIRYIYTEETSVSASHGIGIAYGVLLADGREPSLRRDLRGLLANGSRVQKPRRGKRP
jgi:hypothetical protein